MALATGVQAGKVKSDQLRIVSLSPAITSLIYELGAGEHLAGVTRYCRVPQNISPSPPRVGGALDPELETVLSCSPDLVLAGTLLPPETVKKIQRLGLVVQQWRQDRLSDVIEQVHQLGKLTGREAEAGRRIQASGEYLKSDTSAHGLSRPTALMVFSGDFQTVAGPGTYGQEVLLSAGLENAAAGLKLKWPQVSREWLLAADPDWIILATHRPQSEAEILRKECLDRWKRDSLLGKLEAVRDARVVIVADNRLGIPSLRLLEVIPFLRQATATESPAGAGRL